LFLAAGVTHCGSGPALTLSVQPSECEEAGDEDIYSHTDFDVGLLRLRFGFLHGKRSGRWLQEWSLV
jgi:hypothetical protein